MAGPGQQRANVNFSRYNSAVFEVAQKEVWRVFDWLYHHHHRHQPPVYVGQRVRECEGGNSRIGAMGWAALERKDDPATMDIPLLYKLLQLTCGLMPDGPVWFKPGEVEQQPSLEHRLYLIKQERNKLTHETVQYMHMSDSRLDTLLQELSEHLCHSLRQAGQHSERPAEEVEKAVASVRDRLAHIQATVPPSAMLPQEFALLARRELQEQWEQSGSRAQRLSPPLLRWPLEAREVTLDQLLQGPGGEEGQPPKVLGVVGETGIGKSSLCWQLAEAWLQGEAAAAAAEVVVVVVECRHVFTRDLTRLLLVDLLPQTCRRCHPEEVLGLLGALRVLWLLDGFEEASGDARDLLRRLVEWCSGSSGGHVVVITCQPHYREELDACLAPAATPCYATHCGLTKQGFLSLLATLLQDGQEAAGEAMEGKVKAGEDRGKEAKGESSWGAEEASGESKVTQGEKERSDEEVGVEAQCRAFLQEVQELDPRLLGELYNPLKLVLAVRLWEEGRLGEAAGAPLTRLYAAIQEMLVAKLVARARAGSRLTEAEVRERVRQWVAELCGAALAMWGRGCFVALDEAAEQLLKERAMQLMLPYTDCFSIFLVRRNGPGPKHSFLHHTQQSVLAAQHLHALLLQDITAQKLRALLLPGPPTTITTGSTITTTTTSTTDTTITTTTTTSTTDTTITTGTTNTTTRTPTTDTTNTTTRSSTTNTTNTTATPTTTNTTTSTSTIDTTITTPTTTITTDTTNTTDTAAALTTITDTNNTTTTTTPTTADNPTTLDHFLDTLVEAAASLAAAGSLSEGRAKVLAELLEQCRLCPWLEVVRRTACCPSMAREVRPRLTEEWKVTDAHVQASAVLADIQTPACITIDLHDNPDNLPHLLPLLHCLAKAHVRVRLHNLYSILPTTPLPSPCDSLLLPLCGPASLCSLNGFIGTLSAEGYRSLRRQRHNLVFLLGGMPDLTALEELIQLTHHMEHLVEVKVYLFGIFRSLPSESVSPKATAHLFLMCVEDKEAEDAVILARRIKHAFKSIRLGRASPSTVCRMVKAFREQRVRTPSLGRIGWFQVNGILQCVSTHFFPLPLPTNMTPREVYRMWDKMELRVTVDVEVERHSRDTGTVVGADDSCSGAGQDDVAGP